MASCLDSKDTCSTPFPPQHVGCRRRGVSHQKLKAELEFHCFFFEFALKAASLISFFFSYDPWSSRGHFYINFSPSECRYVDKTFEDVNFKCSTYPNSINNTWIGLPYGKMTVFFLLLTLKSIGCRKIYCSLLLLFCTLKIMEISKVGVNLGFYSLVLSFLKVTVLLFQDRLEKYLLTFGKKWVSLLYII